MLNHYGGISEYIFRIFRIHQYLFDEVSHFHLRPLLRHVGLHLRVRVVDDGQEHVLHRDTLKQPFF